MRTHYLLLLSLLAFLSCKEAETISEIEQNPFWQEFDTQSSSSLRGIAAVDSLVCWASGSGGTVLLSVDGGKNWLDRSVPGMDTIQFRDIQAFNKDTALVISAGLPALIFKTTDAGKTWNLKYENLGAGVFFDAMDFWDINNGIAFSDAPEDRLLIIRTNDGGESWTALPDSLCPKVLQHQGGFAASGTCLRALDSGRVIIGLGGDEATVLLSTDYGLNWSKSKAPLDSGAPSKGIYSFAGDANVLFCSGGDYLGDSLSLNTLAKSLDQGQSWTLVEEPSVSGYYRSCISFVDSETIFAVSRTGTSYSLDRGKNWKQISGQYYSLSTGKDYSLWASGSNGRIAQLRWD